MKKEEAFALLGKYPELVPLSDEQKRVFKYLWDKYTDYKNRQRLVSKIPDLYSNRLRYRELLTDKEDIEMFNAILRDGDTIF